MQFKVPQNIDLEDRIVGPLTLIQFVYCLVGGLICYIIYQLFPDKMFLVFLLDIPIALVAIALAFLKIQDQPLSHFIVAGLNYYNRPKIRFWNRFNKKISIISEAPQEAPKETTLPQKRIEKSNLEKLAYVLDTKPLEAHEQKNFGKITQNFEKIIEKVNINNQGGGNGTMGKKQAPSR